MTMLRSGAGLLAMLLVVCPAAALAEASPSSIVEGGTARGETGFDPYDYEYCLSCHGAVGQGNAALQAPALAGMESWYLRGQLLAFRAGWRGSHEADLAGMEMRAIAAALEAVEIDAVIDYVAALPAQRPAVAAKTDLTAAAALYGACVACHGARAEGNRALQAPALWYQQEAYLRRQMLHFRDGVRGSAAGDEHGAIMRAAARDLEDADIERLVAYIRTLRP